MPSPSRSTKESLLTPEQIRETIGTLVVGTGAVYLLLLLLPGNGTLATSIQHTSFHWVGLGAWLFGAACCITGVKFFDGHSWKKGFLSGTGGILGTLCFLGLSSYLSHSSGGVIGASLGQAMSHVFGEAASAALLLMVILLGLVMTANIRLSVVVRSFGGAVHNLMDTLSSRVLSVHEEDEEEAPVAHLRGVPMPPANLLPEHDEEEEDEDEDVHFSEAASSIFKHVVQRKIDLPEDEEQTRSTITPALSESDPPLFRTTDSEDPETKTWKLPPMSLLDKTESPKKRVREGDITAIGQTIVGTLKSFGIETSIVGVSTGPTVTQFEIRPAPGVSVRKILNHQTDLSLAVAAPVRIQPFLIGKSAVAIEVPHQSTQIVSMREIVTAQAFSESKGILKVVLGADVSGAPTVGDLTEMPHLLVAGATGSGKSVLINSLIAGFLLQATPASLRLILIDPKRVELSSFADLPHLLVPVVVEPDAAVSALRWAVKEMEDRYKLLAGHGMRNIAKFNDQAPKLGIEPLPYVVILIDELADLMMVAAGEIEDLVCRLAQLARAVGIHLVVATQRPSTDIITGLIKANIPSRIAFAVSSGVDSRVILDELGAEKLLGHGDMLYLPIGEGRPKRLQGAYLSDRERDEVVMYWKRQGPPSYEPMVLEVGSSMSSERDIRKRDPLFPKAAHLVASEGRAATSLLQRKLEVGYARAARIIDQLAEYRVVGPFEGSKSRAVLMDPFQVDELLDELNEDSGD
ncbi:MAG: DNA translocase FtsK 4TM domain-containing protein [Candidatus Dormibacteria bacterium]